MAEPTDMIVPLLREMRTETKDRFDKIDRKLAQHDEKFEKIERRLGNIREAMNGGSVLGRYAAAEVEERLEAIEKRLAMLESRS